ncbi:MAG: glycosyltransferase involved in cell wall biosynthesis [Planctomycetota bacterium]
MSAPHNPCALVPTYDNPLTVRAVIERIHAAGLDVILIDDGSHKPGLEACRSLEQDGLVTLRRLEVNSGKGAALLHGFQLAHELGYTHAFQIDADAQHDLQRIPAFLEASRTEPAAAILGYPIYDEKVPFARRWGRLFTAMWVNLEVASTKKIADALIGFRIYPVAAALACKPSCQRMGIDIELAVGMVRAGTPTQNMPVGVTYPSPEEGGISHFHMLKDNLRFSALHARLCTAGCFRWLGRLVGVKAR